MDTFWSDWHTDHWFFTPLTLTTDQWQRDVLGNALAECQWLATASGRDGFGVTPPSKGDCLRSSQRMLLELIGLALADVSVPDRGVCLSSTVFTAVCGTGAGATRAASPDYGAGSQGMHMGSAVRGIASVSVPPCGLHALSDLQWPLKIGTWWCGDSSRYTVVPSWKDTEGPAPRL